MKCFEYNFQKMLSHVILNIKIYFLMTTLSLLKYVKKYILKSKTLGYIPLNHAYILNT